MIVDSLRHAARYPNLGPRFEAAFEYLLKTDFGTLQEGKYFLDEDRLFAIAFRYTTRPIEQGEWEAHRRYADVQYIVSGAEWMGVAQEGRLDEQPYDAEHDCLVLTGACNDRITVHAGEFVIFWPGEAHMPNMAIDAPGPVFKVVLKVACD